MYLLCTSKNEIIFIGTLNSMAVGPGWGRGEGEAEVLPTVQSVSEAIGLAGKYFPAVLQMRRDFVNESPTRDGYQ
jgi:hypothetical protein